MDGTHPLRTAVMVTVRSSGQNEKVKNFRSDKNHVIITQLVIKLYEILTEVKSWFATPKRTGKAKANISKIL